MTEPLTDNQIKHLLNFIGYGTLDADVWFLGMEEAGGGGDNIRTRLNFRVVEDLAEAHKLLGVTHLHWGKRKIQRTWRGMCYIMLRLEGKEPAREAIRHYQAEKLGRFNGNTLLTELMPIPKPKINQWEYKELIPQFTSRADYYETVQPKRIQYLRRLIKEHKPKVIVGYGKAFWTAYKKLFPKMQFTPEDQFETGFDNQTLTILTGHFRARSMNGKFDDVVSIIRKYLPAL